MMGPPRANQANAQLKMEKSFLSGNSAKEKPGGSNLVNKSGSQLTS